MFSSGYTFGFPPDDYGLTAYLNLLDQVAPGAQWMVGGLSVDILSLIPRVVAEGGHVRVGLEDAPLGSTRSNQEWVEAAVHAIDHAGGTLATPEDVRALLTAVEMGDA
jgi:3-keto-5-aminohexanoate cleavage enzyme